MKRSLFTLVALFLLASWTRAEEPALRLALVAPDDDAALAKALDLAEATLMQDRKFEMVERRECRQVLAEQKLSRSFDK